MVVFLPTMVLVLYTIMQSKVLSDFLEALPNERLHLKEKLGMLFKVWSDKPKVR